MKVANEPNDAAFDEVARRTRADKAVRPSDNITAAAAAVAPGKGATTAQTSDIVAPVHVASTMARSVAQHSRPRCVFF